MALMRHLKLAGLAAVLVTLVGCASVGRDFATHNVDQITIGETTRAEIQEMFGEPGAPVLKTASAPGLTASIAGPPLVTTKPRIWWSVSITTARYPLTYTTLPNKSSRAPA